MAGLSFSSKSFLRISRDKPAPSAPRCQLRLSLNAILHLGSWSQKASPHSHIYISIHEPHTHAIRTLPPPPYPMGVVCSCTVCMYNPSTLDSLRLFSNILAQAHSVAHTSLVSLSLSLYISLPLAPVQHRHGNAESPSILCELCNREGVRERGFRKCHPGSKVITRPPEERKTGR